VTEPTGAPPGYGATLAALQGGLLLTQSQRRVKPLEAALDSMLDLIRSRTANT
jgi:TetR/AcrR family transcriptional regulator, transcriptional repressor for nem operon